LDVSWIGISSRRSLEDRHPVEEEMDDLEDCLDDLRRGRRAFDEIRESLHRDSLFSVDNKFDGRRAFDKSRESLYRDSLYSVDNKFDLVEKMEDAQKQLVEKTARLEEQLGKYVGLEDTQKQLVEKNARLEKELEKFIGGQQDIVMAKISRLEAFREQSRLDVVEERLSRAESHLLQRRAEVEGLRERLRGSQALKTTSIDDDGREEIRVLKSKLEVLKSVKYEKVVFEVPAAPSRVDKGPLLEIREKNTVLAEQISHLQCCLDNYKVVWKKKLEQVMVLVGRQVDRFSSLRQACKGGGVVNLRKEVGRLRHTLEELNEELINVETTNTFIVKDKVVYPEVVNNEKWRKKLKSVEVLAEATRKMLLSERARVNELEASLSSRKPVAVPSNRLEQLRLEAALKEQEEQERALERVLGLCSREEKRRSELEEENLQLETQLKALRKALEEEKTRETSWSQEALVEAKRRERLEEGKLVSLQRRVEEMELLGRRMVDLNTEATLEQEKLTKTLDLHARREAQLCHITRLIGGIEAKLGKNHGSNRTYGSLESG